MSTIIIPSLMYYKEVVTALREMLYLMADVDGVINVNGGWTVK